MRGPRPAAIARAMSSVEMTPIGQRDPGSVTARCAMPCCAIRLPASAIELSAATLTSGVTAVAPAVSVSRSSPRGRDEIEVRDDPPQPGRLVALVRVLEDEDRMHAVGRHHPGHDPERRLGRAAEDPVGHRVAHPPGLERKRDVFAAMLHEHHARIVTAPWRNRIRVNYGTDRDNC